MTRTTKRAATRDPRQVIYQSEHLEKIATDQDVLEALHPGLDHKRIVELGCGRAELTRFVATAGAGRDILALEVDEIQHRKNLAITDLLNVRFEFAGAQDIPCADSSVDVVFMFKSLHHVPLELMDRALEEICRVLRPGGLAHISEPIYAGEYNDLLRLFHDERRQRTAAFEAVVRAVESRRFELAGQVFHRAPLVFADFEAFEAKVVNATHNDHNLSAECYAEVRTRFATHAGPGGARFLQPMRVDLLGKPG